MRDGTVHILDDCEPFRQATAWWLEGLGWTVREYAEPEPALAALAAPDRPMPCCLLLDVRMPTMSGLDVHDRLNACAPDVPVIYMTGHADVPLAVRAMRKGATTFLEKPLDDGALLAALEAALDACGERARSAGGAGSAPSAAAPAGLEPALAARLATLTPREREVYALLERSRTSREIAATLGINIKTAEVHRSRVLHKFGVGSTVQLLRLVLGGGDRGVSG